MKVIHGHTTRRWTSRTYQSWHMMVQRCTNPKYTQYQNYGGRGITVCEQWLKFDSFLADMGERPPSTTLERADNDRGYEQNNCSWATRKQQARNTRQNRWLTHDGQTKLLTDWAAELGMKQHSLSSRIDRYGWSIERALTTPPINSGRRRTRKEVETV